MNKLVYILLIVLETYKLPNMKKIKVIEIFLGHL